MASFETNNEDRIILRMKSVTPPPVVMKKIYHYTSNANAWIKAIALLVLMILAMLARP